MALTAHLTRAGVEDLIREAADRPSIGDYRKIAAALLPDHGIDVSQRMC